MIIHMSGDTFGNNLIYLRKKYALYRRALARLIGVSEYLLKGIEDGTYYPELPVSAFQRLCEVFHIPSDTLVQNNLNPNNIQ